MSPETLRSLSWVHGLAAWTSLLSLAWIAFISLRSQHTLTRGRTIWAAVFAVLSLSVTASIGFLLHMPYQHRLRQRVFIEAPALGLLFERKEHLAFAALALAWCAAFALAALKLRSRTQTPTVFQNDSVSRHLQRTIRFAFTASALLAAAAGVAAAIVAHRFSFS